MMSQSPSLPIYFAEEILAAPAARSGGYCRRQVILSSGTRIYPEKRMSPPTEDNLGRRRFLLHRDKAVEHALERIRRAPDSGWEALTPEERARLKEVLNEIWENCDRERWHEYCFAILTKTDILILIALGNDIKTRHHMTDETRGAIEAILLSCSTDGHLH
jgi:hypothetical protein